MTDSYNQFRTETSTVSNFSSYHFSNHEAAFLKILYHMKTLSHNAIWLSMEKSHSMFRPVALLFFMTWDNVIGKYKMFQINE